MLEKIQENLELYINRNRGQERSEAPLSKANELMYITFARKDLKQTAEFMSDFGLRVKKQNENQLLMHGAGSAPVCYQAVKAKQNKFLGLGFGVADKKQLIALAEATNRTVLNHPLGGEYIKLFDPAGNSIEVSVNIPRRKVEQNATVPTNTSTKAPRSGSTVRLDDMPAQVIRLGHTVLSGPKNSELIAWYTKYLGFIVSDFQFIPGDPEPVMAFMRLDCGPKPTDHHTIGIGSAIHVGHVHSAFEVNDFNSLTQGSKFLAKRSAHHSWGIGRHFLGSQIFDYWRDPSGDLFELYTDGDLFSADVATGYYKFSKDSLAQWGPPATNDFMDKNLKLRTIKSAATRLFGDDELTLERLVGLAKLS